MSTINIHVPRQVTGEDAGYIAITAAEGGIGYWSVIDSYRPGRWMADGGYGFDEPIDVDIDFVFYTVVDVTEGTLDDLRDDCVARDVELDTRVTPRLIARGIELFLTGQHPHSASTGRVFHDMEDFAAMDSGEADMVIQLGMFGKLVFG